MKDPVQHLTKNSQSARTLCGKFAEGHYSSRRNQSGSVGYYNHWPMGHGREDCFVEPTDTICKTCLKIAEHLWAIGALGGADT